MNEPTVPAAVSNPKRRRLRFGMRSLIGVVLLFGLVFGWLARMQRDVVEQEAVVNDLARDRIVVNLAASRPSCAWSLPSCVAVEMFCRRLRRNSKSGSAPVGFHAPSASTRVGFASKMSPASSNG